ncbi:MAG TPA: hypothetical protein VF824_19600 [Thermoanaerobaculia bacterium]|jgi:hypothetical protein
MNAREERLAALRTTLPPHVAATIEVPWRTSRLLAQIVFFILTAIGMEVLYFFCDTIGLPAGFVTGAVGVGLAEYLIGVRRWWNTGVEPALWLGAMIAFVTLLPRSGTPEAMLVLALACGIAGARVRHPLIGAVGAGFVVAWCEQRFDLGVVAALAIGAAALLALTRTWQRPSNEHLCVALLLLVPAGGWFAADAEWRRATIALYAAFGALALIAALRRRHHAMFAAAAIGLGIAGFESSRLVAAPAALKLAAGGALLLAIAFAVSRALRGRTSGFVTMPEAPSELAEAAELGGTLAASQLSSSKSGETAPDERPQDGGGFGGAGATGDY